MAKHTLKKRKIHKHSGKKNRLQKKLRRTDSIKGGAVFNSPMDFAKQPPGTLDPLNLYSRDVSHGPYHMSSRLIGGRKRRNQTKKIRGGSFLSDPLNQSPLGSNSNSNAVFSFGTTSGGKWLANELSGVGNRGGPITTYNQNGPTPPLV